jgi:hypothetical protein
MHNALILLAVLPLACASAAAAPEPTKPTAESCRPRGAVVFEIDHRVEPGAKLSTSTVKVFASGAWTREETDADGKALAPRGGCIAKPELKQLETTLHGATWKVTIARIHCMAVSESYTVYQVDGKPVFTDKLCSGAALDDKSRAKLDAATQLVEREIARSP